MKKHSEFLSNPQLRNLIEEFKATRKYKGISQEELSYRIGVGERYVSMWECGYRTPKLINALYWAESLNSKLILVNKNTKSRSIANDNGLKII